MSIYRLYQENGNRAGFWIQHRTWQNVCAQVQSIDGRDSGQLRGTSPEYDGASVVIKGFDVRSGRPVELGALQQEPHDRNFARIAQPQWYRAPKEELANGL